MKNKNIFILGMARSGYEAAKLLSKDNTVFVTDIKDQDELQIKELESLGVKFEVLSDPTSLLDSSFDIVVKNPGIKYTHPTVLKAHELKIPVINEMEVAYHYLKPNVNIIGVTGSNGKTTTVTLIDLMLKEEKENVYLGGNIGLPFCHFVEDVKTGDYVVLEISDHQLCDMHEFKTNVSVLTNIYQVHLDFHDSFERYKEMKKRIFNHHTKDDLAIINHDNEESLKITKDILSQKRYFSKTLKEQAYLKDNAIYYQDEKIIETNEIKLRGMHNYENIIASICVVKEYGLKNESICKVLKEFPGVPHRIEYVDTIGGVAYYNDSKSTNCEATKIALNSFETPILLLLGGLDRGHSFEDLNDSLSHLKMVACYGETKERIQKYCQKQGIPCQSFANLIEATTACKASSTKGDTVLLSPACASWDQYDAFETRGNEFKDLVHSWKEDK